MFTWIGRHRGGGDPEETPKSQGRHGHHCNQFRWCAIPIQMTHAPNTHSICARRRLDCLSILFLPAGIPIRTTLDNSTTVQYAGLIHHLTAKARAMVRDVDPTDNLCFLRVRSKKHEIMIAPDNEYILICIQNAESA